MLFPANFIEHITGKVNQKNNHASFNQATLYAADGHTSGDRKNSSQEFNSVEAKEVLHSGKLEGSSRQLSPTPDTRLDKILTKHLPNERGKGILLSID